MGATFESGRYRRFKNYFYFAKDCHEELDYPWARQLQRMGKRTIRSLYREIGLPEQSGSIGLLELHQLDLFSDPVVMDA